MSCQSNSEVNKINARNYKQVKNVDKSHKRPVFKVKNIKKMNKTEYKSTLHHKKYVTTSHCH